MSMSCYFFLCCVRSAGLFFSSIQLKLLPRLVLGVGVTYLHYCSILCFCSWQMQPCSLYIYLDCCCQDRYPHLLPWVSHNSVSLHYLLLLHCNKCTTFPYSHLNDTVISTKSLTVTSIGTVISLSIISFSIFRHASPIFHLSLHPGVGGNPHKHMQTWFVFWPQKVCFIDWCYYIFSFSSPIRLSDSIYCKHSDPWNFPFFALISTMPKAMGSSFLTEVSSLLG